MVKASIGEVLDDQTKSKQFAKFLTVYDKQNQEYKNAPAPAAPVLSANVTPA